MCLLPVSKDASDLAGLIGQSSSSVSSSRSGAWEKKVRLHCDRKYHIGHAMFFGILESHVARLRDRSCVERVGIDTAYTFGLVETVGLDTTMV